MVNAPSAGSSDPARLSLDEPGIAVIRIDRAERRNALNMQVKQSLQRALEEASSRPDVRAVVITGGDKVFVAGTDLAEMAEMSAEDHARIGTNEVFIALRACPLPTIAAVEGYALGGGAELAMACDMIVAGEGARFGQPEIRVGIMPGAGGTQLLPRILGRHRAMSLLLTGEPISAVDAYSLGLVSKLASSGEATTTAIDLARTIAAMPPLAVRAIRDAVREGLNGGVDEGLTLERRHFVALFDTADQKEGMRAFLEKRAPQFQGR